MNTRRLTAFVIVVFLSLTFQACNKNSATDYSKTEYWLSFPRKIDQDVDIFYLYPTAWKKINPREPNICKINNPSMMESSKIAFDSQASAFETIGNIYAPYYRQIDSTFLFSLTPTEQDIEMEGIPKSDVMAAFDYYIRHNNNGRPYILAGHSQGSSLILYLLSDYMKANPEIYERMIAAYVIGCSVTESYLAKNPHLKFAKGPSDTGVIVSFNTQAPKIEGSNPVVLPYAKVINPITWTLSEKLATTQESLGSYLPIREGNLEKVDHYADAYLDLTKGVVICSTADVDTLAPGNKIFGRGVFHTFDYLLYYFNIRENAANRKSNYMSKQKVSYLIDNDVFTTLTNTVVPFPVPSASPKLLPYETSKYSKNGYGVWKFGKGLVVQKRLDLMPTASSKGSVTNTAKLLRFFTLTDIHITDEESPAQGIFLGYKGGSSSAYSPVMLYSTQVLDAAVQTINTLHKENPIDFGISLGDAINNNQYNELRWYINILDGKTVNPDSGSRDDPLPGPSNDYQDEFKPAGLDYSIPWYQVIGNHDHFWMGTFPVNKYIRSAYIGSSIVNLGNIFTDPLGIESRGFYMGAIDGRTPYGDIIGAGKSNQFKVPPKLLAADHDRFSLSKAEWMKEFFKTLSSPVGHGFSQYNLDKDFACYTFEPKTDVPLKVIVLDDTQNEYEPLYYMYGHGSLDKSRYDWLVGELDKGQKENKLMIIASHIPIGVKPFSTDVPFMDWSPSSYVTEKNLIDKLHVYPNLILWISGHRHRNAVTAFPSPDPKHPELGFWEVETSSLRDYPQQFRLFDIVRNNNNTISIFATDVDPAVSDGSLAALSRSYAVAAQQIFKNPLDPMPEGSYNAELVKLLSPKMQKLIQNYGTPLGK